LFLHYADLADSGTITDIVWKINPDEVYHLGAQSHVKVSFELPEYSGDITGIGTTRLLEAIRRSGIKTKFYQASSSEMFGASPPPQNENSPFYPRSPYAVAKVYAYWITINYREAYNLFACNGILFNHESPRRGETFVTRKITRALANILSGKQTKLYLGNLYAKRDWGYAPEYVQMMWLMLQQEEPDDYVVGTGESHTIKEFVELAFDYAGIELEWKGNGIEEKGVVKSLEENVSNYLKPGEIVVEIDPKYFRPTEVEFLQADITKAKQKLNWQPKVKYGVKKLLNLGSSCIYPKHAPQPMKEEYLLSGYLEPTNEAYAIAKIAAIKLCRYYNEQYKTNFISVMPTNLYGPGDNYNLETSHVLPAFIRKFHLAKLLEQGDIESIKKDFQKNPLGFGLDNEIDFNNKETLLKALSKLGINSTTLSNTSNVSLTIWGTGEVYREFMHVEDLADACIFLMKNIDAKDMKKLSPDYFVNIGTGEDIKLKDLAYLIKNIVGFKGEIKHDLSKPDGTPRKLLDVSKIKQLGWEPKIGLEEGIKGVYEYYVKGESEK